MLGSQKKVKVQPSGAVGALMDLIASSIVDVRAKNAAAVETWGLTDGGAYTADLTHGTLTCEFESHRIAGPVRRLGTFANSSNVWTWGWASSQAPGAVTAASLQVRVLGWLTSLQALTANRVALASGLMPEDFAAVAGETAGLGGMFAARSVDNEVAYLGFDWFERHPLETAGI